MNTYLKYINLDAVASFRRNMSTRGKVPYHTLQECLYTKSGSRRSPFTVSKKFEKSFNGVHSIGMYLAPATMVNGLNTCRGSGLCKHGCIAFTNNLATKQSQDKQYFLTIALYHHTLEFLQTVIHDIFSHAHDFVFKGYRLAVRLNSTSDLPFYQVLDLEAIVRDCKNLSHFYDYTKIPSRHRVSSEFYHLTYSVSELSTQKWVDRFDRVAMVVSKKDQKTLLKQYPSVFVDGDKHDLRALDGSKYVLLAVKRVSGFQQMNKTRQVSEDFVCTVEQVLQYADLQGVTQ